MILRTVLLCQPSRYWSKPPPEYRRISLTVSLNASVSAPIRLAVVADQSPLFLHRKKLNARGHRRPYLDYLERLTRNCGSFQLRRCRALVV